MQAKEDSRERYKEDLLEAAQNILDRFNAQEKGDRPTWTKAAHAPRLADLRVLIVDDSRVIRLMTKRHLQEFGIEKVDQAANGSEALEAMRQDKPDVVLLDWNMPGMSGLEVVQAMHQDKELHRVPILMVTARNSREDVMAAMKAGIFSYIVKPLNPEALEKKLRQLCA